GVLPLALAHGAGAGAMRASGVAVVGGVVTSTFLVTLFAPLFYVVIENTFGRRKPAVAPIEPATAVSP
ncbi:MAG TPA: efflux RND transporter permease subunit, partial [Verrucomicrobiota bacterium]|nr:efflux RND transporter permease subunit [Verrucomicrobiota bacterium]